MPRRSRKEFRRPPWSMPTAALDARHYYHARIAMFEIRKLPETHEWSKQIMRSEADFIRTANAVLRKSL